MRARALAETVEDHELLDPLLPPDRLLYRLFHEEQVRAYRAIGLETYCSCSRERVEELLRRFTSEDLKDMVVDGEVWVTCEFCNSRYRFDPASFTKSDEWTSPALAPPAPVWLRQPEHKLDDPGDPVPQAVSKITWMPGTRGHDTAWWKWCLFLSRSASLARNVMQASSWAW